MARISDDDLVTLTTDLMKLCEEANHKMFDLPRIAVVGGQSTGKSSVLESIVGLDFLPKGNGMVTRRPLVLTLLTSKDKESNEIYAYFDNKEENIIHDCAQIKEGIDRRTKENITGDHNVTSKPIYLTIKSSIVPNLILVDLPGLIKNVVEGQKEETVRLIQEMVEGFIRDPNTIILAISAANVDIANSDALRLAKKFDPEQNRTLGVLTKIDRSENHIETVKVLSGVSIPLKLGFVGVKLRSLTETNEGKSLIRCREEEELFFKTQPEYATVRNHCGVPFLSKKLSQLLITSIKNELPKIRETLNSRQKSIDDELKKMKSPYEEVEKVPSELISKFIRAFVQKYQDNLIGDFDPHSRIQNKGGDDATPDNNAKGKIMPGRSVSPPPVHSLSSSPIFQISEKKKLFGGALVRYTIREGFYKELDNVNNELSLDDDQLKIAVHNSDGINTSVFIPEPCFRSLMSEVIDRLRVPIMVCIESCLYACSEIIMTALSEIDGLLQYRRLYSRLQNDALDILKRWKDDTEKRCLSYVDVEKSYINVNNPEFKPIEELEFIQDEFRVKEEDKRKRDPKPLVTQPYNPGYGSQRSSGGQQTLNKTQDSFSIRLDDTVRIMLIRALVKKYFMIVKRNMSDIIPRTVMYNFIERSKKCYDEELRKSLINSETNYEDLLMIDPDLKRRKDDLESEKREIKQYFAVLERLNKFIIGN